MRLRAFPDTTMALAPGLSLERRSDVREFVFDRRHMSGRALVDTGVREKSGHHPAGQVRHLYDAFGAGHLPTIQLPAANLVHERMLTQKLRA